MDRYGFIHEKLEIKILILFILNRLPRPVGLNDLTDLVMCDDGISYFDFSEALSELMESDHISEKDGLYSITLKGVRNGTITENNIPYSVRLKAERSAIRLARIQQRSAMIKTESHPRAEGGYFVRMSLADGMGEMISMNILAGSETQAHEIEKNFQKKAESLYNEIMTLLLDK